MCEKNNLPQETIELTDDQLEQAAGGCEFCENAVIGDKKQLKCDKCFSSSVYTTEHEYRGDNWYCTICNYPWHNGGLLMVG